MNSELIRKDFPILETKVNGHPVVYFDNGATTQRPLPVMRTVMDYVTRNNGNPHRGAHIFAMSASEAYDTSKTVVKDFIGAKSEKEIIYTRNTSESLNLVARSYGETHLKEGDRILIPVSEHHSNLVPWQRAAKKTGAVLEYNTDYTEHNVTVQVYPADKERPATLPTPGIVTDGTKY